MEKIIEQLVQKVKEGCSKMSTRSDSGYDSVGVGKVVPSDDEKAIAYELKGSQWQRGGTHGGGVSYFQGINAFDGEIVLTVRSYGCYRAKYFHPWDIEDILEFKHLNEKKYELAIGNEYKRLDYLVDFGKKEVKLRKEEKLKQIVISGPEASDW